MTEHTRLKVVTKMSHVYEPRKLPVILCLEEVTRLLQAAGGPKYQAALGVAYGAGLRANEVVHLTTSDIDSERMVIVVFTLSAPISAIAYHNEAVIYGLPFQVAAETLRTIAVDPRPLGARIGLTLVLHTWGSVLTHHTHVHGIAPGGGLSPDGQRWIACKPGFFLPVHVLSRLFRRRFLEALTKTHAAGQLRFFGEYAALADSAAFTEWLAPLRQCEWVIYVKRPFAGSAAVLAYLARYTYRVVIANSRLIAVDERGVTFKWKDYRAKGKTKYRPAPIRAAFALCHHDVRFRVIYRRRIWCDRAATDNFSDGVISMTNLIDTSCHQAAIQIPIAMWPDPTSTQHPGVSSLVAYPTPAH